MTRAKSFLLVTIAFLLLTGCSASVWETSPLGRKLRHLGDPVIGQIGDMPIYQSDGVAVYTMLPIGIRDSIKINKNAQTLADTVAEEYSWRKAAIEKGALASTDFAARATHAENEAFKDWLMLHSPDLNVSDAEVTQYIAQNPSYFTEHRFLAFRTDRYDKRSRKLLTATKQTRPFSQGTPEAPELRVVSRLQVGKTSDWVSCGADLCRYTRDRDFIQLAQPPDLARQTAAQILVQTKKTQWLKKYQESQHVSISTGSLSEIIKSN